MLRYTHYIHSIYIEIETTTKAYPSGKSNINKYTRLDLFKAKHYESKYLQLQRRLKLLGGTNVLQLLESSCIIPL